MGNKKPEDVCLPAGRGLGFFIVLARIISRILFTRLGRVCGHLSMRTTLSKELSRIPFL